MGDPLREKMFNSILDQNPQAFIKPQETYVRPPINTTINPYPSIGQMFPNVNNQLLSGNLTAPNMQQYSTQPSSGVGRFLGLLGSPIITSNIQGK